MRGRKTPSLHVWPLPLLISHTPLESTHSFPSFHAVSGVCSPRITSQSIQPQHYRSWYIAQPYRSRKQMKKMLVNHIYLHSTTCKSHKSAFCNPPNQVSYSALPYTHGRGWRTQQSPPLRPAQGDRADRHAPPDNSLFFLQHYYKSQHWKKKAMTTHHPSSFKLQSARSPADLVPYVCVGLQY